MTLFLVSLKWQLNVDPIILCFRTQVQQTRWNERCAPTWSDSSTQSHNIACNFQTRIQQPDGMRDVLLPRVAAQH